MSGLAKGFTRLFGESDAAPDNAGLPAGLRLYAVGDVHGCLERLDHLIEQIVADAAAHDAERKLIVFLGDYVDRGPDSRGVLERLMAGPPEGFEQICLKGNHEAFMVRFLKTPKDGETWMINGGLQTCASYGVDCSGDPFDHTVLARMHGEMTAAVPQAHRDFLASLELYHAEGGYLFVHAGIRPGVSLRRQAQSDLLWIREQFLMSEEDHGYVVVHGHTPSDEVDERPNRIGIDTGAVYGGKLTAMVLEGEERNYLYA